MIARYAGRPDSESPFARDEETRRRLPAIQAALLAALPAVQRPAVRLLLRQAQRTVPLRGVGKASFLQALDVARAAARRIGEHLESSGRLERADDVFYLTAGEITEPLPGDAKDRVAERRARRAEFQELDLPSSWRGVPEPKLRTTTAASTAGELITGVGAAAGIVEGRVRVVSDPTFVEVEPGEILVAHTTDPSWASIMFVSAALVVDIGSALSHAAVVARELGIPCVANTGSGTQRLRDGDLVRVDGTKGTVEILTGANA
jgi:pyruvate,water dikinase